MTLSPIDRRDLKILNITDLTPTVRTFTLQKPEEWTWLEGAHARFGVWIDDQLDQRTMSVSSWPLDQVITMTTRKYATTSPYKAALWQKTVGETLSVTAPKSRFTLPRENRPLLLLAMGVGMATLVPLIRTYQASTENIPSVKILTVDREINLLSDLDLPQGLHTHTLNRVGFMKALDHLMREDHPIVMAIGSDRFVESVVRSLKAKGFQRSDLRLDKKATAIDRIWDSL
jgi:ferredoxin--NADP+ reductase